MTTRVIQAGRSVRVAVEAPTVSVGPTTTLPAGSQAVVTNIGTDKDVLLAFAIPQGANGLNGGGSSTGDMLKADNLAGLTNIATARNNLGLGTLAVKSSVSDTDWSGADLSVANGGTGASSPSAARDALGVPAGSGTSTGTNTGDQTSVTGNAGTATKLQTARTINGVAFDGTANITLPTAAITDVRFPVNFTAAADAYIPAYAAMTIAQGNAPIGTGTVAYAASTSAAPATFSTVTLPATLQAGAWLKVSVTAVTGFYALDLYRSA